jgi:alpha-glucoside transport system substrate-binding protein
MRIRKLTALVALTALAVAALVATSTAGAKTKHRGVSGSISITGVWTGAEEQNFQAVIDGFTKANPDVKVKYTSSGDQTPTVLATAVAGGNPPDLASVSQPGLMKDFANRGALKPIDFAKGVIAANYTPSWSTLGSVNGHLYGLFFKGANKSTVWYNVKAFKNAGVKPPATWTALLAAAKTLRASGTPAYAIGGADGWTLTD